MFADRKSQRYTQEILKVHPGRECTSGGRGRGGYIYGSC